MYFLLCGEVLQGKQSRCHNIVDDKSLDLEQTLDRPPTTLANIMGQFILSSLDSKYPDIFIKTELNKIREKGDNNAAITVENNIKFLSQLLKKQGGFWWVLVM